MGRNIIKLIYKKMTEQQYYEQNRKGFEGDNLLKQFVASLLKKNNIKHILEGGTYLGSTTKHFCEMVDSVDSIEVNSQYYDTAKEYLKDKKNLRLIFGSTVNVMPKLLKEYENDNYLFFCDSHWGPHNPLLEELKIIADYKHKPFIIIHDFKVPGHPELGYDSYNGQDYEWGWIKAGIEKIYGPDGYTIQYNTKAEGAKRGIIFISPKA